MSNILNLFSTREIALAIWFLIFLMFVSRTKDIRHSIVCVAKAFFAKKFIWALSTLLLYVLLIVFILSHIGLWDISLLKETILWLLFSGIVLFININKTKSVNYFLNLIKGDIKVLAIWEFLFNFYTLSLLWELILIPVIFFFTRLKAFADQDVNYKKVVSLCGNVLGIIALIMIGYVTYKTFTEYELLFSTSNLKSLLLPIILLLLTLPYFYALALYMNYKSFIAVVKLKHVHRYERSEVYKGLIKATLKYANVNISTLKRIWEYQINFDPLKENPDEFIKRVIKKPRYVISDKAKLKKFNDVKAVIKGLSMIGIGRLSDWHKACEGDDCYLSMTDHYQLDISDLTMIPNTLAFYLTGEETYIKQLEIVLDIGYKQSKDQAIGKFITVLAQTFDILDVYMPNNLTNSIIEGKGFDIRYNTHNVLLNYEKFKRIDKYILKITTTIKVE